MTDAGRRRRWHLEFYHRASGTLARYALDAASPEAAVAAGRRAAVAEHPTAVGRPRRPSLFARAEHASGQDDSGWVLYRIHGAGDHAANGVEPSAPSPEPPPWT